jgi:HK97 gp10 family phage protein
MQGFDFTTPGLAGFEQKLIELGTNGARRVGRAALRQSTNVVMRETRLLARRRTGLLIRSIQTRDRGIRGDTIYFSVSVMQRAFYGKFLEFGTSRMPAYPFMRPAAENTAVESVEVLALNLGSGLAAEWSKP